MKKPKSPVCVPTVRNTTDPEPEGSAREATSEIRNHKSEIVSTGYRMKDLTPEQMSAAPSIVLEIYLTMKTGQPVDAKELAEAIRKHGGKYFIAPKTKYAKKPKRKSASDDLRSKLTRRK